MTRTRHLSAAAVALALPAALMPSAAGAATPAAGTTAPGGTTTATATCSATEVTSTIKGAWALPDAVAHTAERIRHDTIHCREDALVWRTSRDRTQLSYGLVTPRQAWQLPEREDHRYGWTAVAMDTPWGTQRSSAGTYRVWPRVATAYWSDRDVAWEEAIDAGLVTRSEAQRMRETTGYTGWRVGVRDDGRWMWDIAGD